MTIKPMIGKRLFMLILLACCTWKTYADKLSDAIKTSDAEQVKLLLQEQTVDKHFVKYLDVAEQMIRIRRENVVAQHVRPYYEDSDPVCKFYDRLVDIEFVGLIILPFSGVGIDYFTKKNKLRSPDLSGAMTFLFGLMITVICRDKAIIRSQKNLSSRLNKLHDDAVAIKEMLYDHVNAV